MKVTLERLWNDYLLEECSKIDTDEERALIKKIAELHEVATKSLKEEQKIAVEKYVDALCDVEALFARRAFIKGCEFAVSFIQEAVHSTPTKRP